jgi:hypothetical protein
MAIGRGKKTLKVKELGIVELRILSQIGQTGRGNREASEQQWIGRPFETDPKAVHNRDKESRVRMYS